MKFYQKAEDFFKSTNPDDLLILLRFFIIMHEQTIITENGNIMLFARLP